jgi:WXG100 family type VII secretion target
MLNAIKGAMDPLESDWIGDSGDSFRSEMESDVLPATMRLQEALSTASEVTNTIAQNLRDADEEAKGFFSDWRA